MRVQCRKADEPINIYGVIALEEHVRMKRKLKLALRSILRDCLVEALLGWYSLTFLS